MFGTIFWVIIIIWLGSKLSKGVGNEARAMNWKRYSKEEEKIARKYDPKGYPVPHVLRCKVGDEKFEQYRAEVNELRRKWGGIPLK